MHKQVAEVAWASPREDGVRIADVLIYAGASLFRNEICDTPARGNGIQFNGR